jgi:hypothetical protein
LNSRVAFTKLSSAQAEPANSHLKKEEVSSSYTERERERKRERDRQTEYMTCRHAVKFEFQIKMNNSMFWHKHVPCNLRHYYNKNYLFI